MNKVLGWIGIVMGALGIMLEFVLYDAPDGYVILRGTLFLLMGIALVKNETTK